MDNRTEKEINQEQNAKVNRAEVRRQERLKTKIQNRMYTYRDMETLLKRKETQMTNAVMDLVRQIEKFGYAVTNEDGKFKVEPNQAQPISETQNSQK